MLREISMQLNFRLNRFVPVDVIALTAAVLLAPAPANATPFVLRMTQQGNNVVATGSGAFDLTGLTPKCSACIGTSFETIHPSTAWLNVGEATPAVDWYSGPVTGPASYGSGSSYAATSLASGSTLVFDGTGDDLGSPGLWVPTGYVSGDPLANSTTWTGASFASLGVTPGTYKWTWGTGADQSFTLDVRVSEPAALGMFGLGVLLIGGFVGLRRRVA